MTDIQPIDPTLLKRQYEGDRTMAPLLGMCISAPCDVEPLEEHVIRAFYDRYGLITALLGHRVITWQQLHYDKELSARVYAAAATVSCSQEECLESGWVGFLPEAKEKLRPIFLAEGFDLEHPRLVERLKELIAMTDREKEVTQIVDSLNMGKVFDPVTVEELKHAFKSYESTRQQSVGLEHLTLKECLGSNEKVPELFIRVMLLGLWNDIGYTVMDETVKWCELHQKFTTMGTFVREIAETPLDNELDEKNGKPKPPFLRWYIARLAKIQKEQDWR